jgi:hypothetical protein
MASVVEHWGRWQVLRAKIREINAECDNGHCACGKIPEIRKEEFKAQKALTTADDMTPLLAFVIRYGQSSGNYFGFLTTECVECVDFLVNGGAPEHLVNLAISGGWCTDWHAAADAALEAGAVTKEIRETWESRYPRPAPDDEDGDYEDE